METEMVTEMDIGMDTVMDLEIGILIKWEKY